jgi:uncharacterized protein (TIGR02996 family)
MPAHAPRPELLAFLGAIKAEPEEDTPKLALADWLQEQPDEADQAHGEFLRQFVRNNQLPEGDPAREDFSALIRLWERFGGVWAGALRVAGLKVWATNHMFRWGLLFPVLDLSANTRRAVNELADTEEYAWVAGLAVRAVDSSAVDPFTYGTLLDSLVGLRVAQAEWSGVLLERLCASARLARLQVLDIGEAVGPISAVAQAGT